MKFNKNVNERDSIIFGSYDPSAYKGGVRGFEKMNFDTLNTLVEKGYANPKTAQNASPSIEEILDFLSENPKFKVGGYVVSIDRDDYRVSVDSLYCDEPYETVEDLKAFVMFARFADTLQLDDILYAWWD